MRMYIDERHAHQRGAPRRQSPRGPRWRARPSRQTARSARRSWSGTACGSPAPPRAPPAVSAIALSAPSTSTSTHIEQHNTHLLRDLASVDGGVGVVVVRVGAARQHLLLQAGLVLVQHVTDGGVARQPLCAYGSDMRDGQAQGDSRECHRGRARERTDTADTRST